MSVATRPSYERVEGVVYCHDHGCIHRDSTDPYDTGEAECRTVEHRIVYFRLRKGDIR